MIQLFYICFTFVLIRILDKAMKTFNFELGRWPLGKPSLKENGSNFGIMMKRGGGVNESN